MSTGDPEAVDVNSVDELAEASLRLLGVPPAVAERVASLPLPASTAW